MAKKKLKRTFELDTNVLIHDPNAMYNFDEHDVVIAIPVVEELDRLKNGNEFRNLSARQASRNLMNLIKQSKTSPISLGENKGNLYFVPFNGYPKTLPENQDSSSKTQSSFENIFLEDSADHRIIAIGLDLKKEGKSVTLVTKDNNVFVKARALGINAEDYIHGMVKNPDQLTEKIKEVDPEDLEIISKENEVSSELYFNQPIIAKGCIDGKDHIYRWQGKGLAPSPITRKEIGKTGVKPKNLEQDFAVDILTDKALSAIALIGSAGSGKTLLAVACAICQKEDYDRILVARPAIELSDKTVGYLPGALEEKYNPYLAPIRSSCRFIMDKMDGKKKEQNVKIWMDEQGIELLPLSMIRGETFHRSFIIVDESQNLMANEIKTIVSRAGEGTKIVFTGDINQIDVRYLTRESNGLSHLIERFRGQKYFAYIEMQKSVRSPLAEAADKLL